MKTNTLGRTGIEVSEICLGTMTWGTQNSEDEAHAQMDYAVENGVNFFDTAELYPVTPAGPETYGRTEAYIGTWFEKRGKRDDIVLASKVAGPGRPWIHGGKPTTPQIIRDALDASLKRLKTDYLDLYQIHWPNRRHFHFRNSWDYNPYGEDRYQVETDIAVILDTLDELVKAGKIRAIGLSNESSWGAMRYLALAERKDRARIATIQNEYSLLYRHHDLDMAELSYYEDVGLLAFSPLATGLLTGKYRNGHIPEGSRAVFNPGLGGRLKPHQEPAVEAYCAIAERHGLDPAQMAIAFVLTRPFITAALVGATSLAQLKTDIGAAEVTLSDDVLREIAAVHRQYPMPI
ncbi:aldo/keto reductase [Martelella endophytica]|uniref:Aldo/keto reductase n=1 Tax=Martelella endophytica TaxID=1486262 RepID=A0A0D5LQY3_MAREN|nr:aldo/keto reductase [Martelella endophytica]AJY46634.1 aldo/keto reductase [Martelella endophytica]